MGGGKGDAPDPPNYAKANREAIYADIETLPDRYAARAEWEPLLLQLMLEGQANAADYTADRMLDVQDRYGPGFIEARNRELDMSDPQGRAARDALYNQVMYDLTGEVPEQVDYEVIYPEVVDDGVVGGGANIDIDARIEDILGPRPGTKGLAEDQLEAIVRAIYPPLFAERGIPRGRAQRSNALRQELGLEPLSGAKGKGKDKGKGDAPAAGERRLGQAPELTADEWDQRAARLREQLESGVGGQRGMPEVREIRTPGEYTPNERLYAGEDYESTRMAESLFDQIFGDLGLGAELNDSVRREVSQGVRGGQAARGNILGNSAIYEEAMELGQAGEQRQNQRRQQALGFLSSGVTPEDIAYRKRQQAMANVGSFMSGQTPTAQFGELRGAQQGAAPYAPQNAPQVLDPNAGAKGTQFAQQNYQGQLQAWGQQSNPWMAGLGLGISALGTPLSSTQTVAGSLFG